MGCRMDAVVFILCEAVVLHVLEGERDVNFFLPSVDKKRRADNFLSKHYQALRKHHAPGRVGS